MKKLVTLLLLVAMLSAAFLAFGSVAGASEISEKDSSLLPNDIYVTDGLILFLSAFEGYEDTLSADGKTWTDIFGNEVELKGNRWKMQRGGGLGYRMTYNDYELDYALGNISEIVMDDYLPDASCSVETVMRPTGLTNVDGSRYRDLINSFGTYKDQAFVIGPLKALTGLCLRAEGVTTHALENRWYHHGIGGWHEAKNIVRMKDLSLHTPDVNDVVSYGIYHSRSGPSYDYISRYYIYANGNLSCSYGNPHIPASASEGKLRWMSMFAGDIFVFRLYDHSLTLEERNRNHTADLFAYYGLNTDFFSLARLLTNDADSLYVPFETIGFNMTPEEAEEVITNAYKDVFLSFEGLSVRLDNKVGIRAVFEMDADTPIAFEDDGFSVEAGIGYSIGSRVSTLEDCDEIVTVFSTWDGTNDPYYVDEDHFGIAIYYNSGCDVEQYLEQFSFIGYFRIYDESGGLLLEMTYPAGSENYDNTAFSVYRHMALESYRYNPFIERMIDDCYTVEEFYVSEEGDDAVADGSEESPYATTEAAWAALLDAMENAGEVPTEFILRYLAGRHHVASPIKLTDEHYINGLYRVSILGEGMDNTTLTGGVSLDIDQFEEVPGENYLIYRFEPDENGYPEFRSLYVNNRHATMATQGDNRAADGNQYLTVYNRDHNNAIDPFAADPADPANLVNPKFYLARELFDRTTDEDFKQMELHLQGMWNYNMVHITHVDYNDMIDDGELVAVYIEPEAYANMASPSNRFNGRPYWLENALSFLDEEGEYYYDSDEGLLYYMPFEGEIPEGTVMEYSVIEQMIDIDGVDNVTIRDLTLTAVDDMHAINKDKSYRATQTGGWAEPIGAIVGKDCSYVEVADCTVIGIGGDGMQFTGKLKDITVMSNEITDIGAGGLRFGLFPVIGVSEDAYIMDLTVEDNYVHDVAWFRRESCGIMVTQAWKASIVYNTIRNCSYSAISVGVHSSVCPENFRGDYYSNREVTIAYNYITDFMTDMNDGAAIYTLGGNAPSTDVSYFNYMIGNLVVWSDITGDIQTKGHICGLYNDNCSSNWNDSENIQLINPDRWWNAMRYHYVQSDQVHDILIDNNYYAGIPEELPEGVSVLRTFIYSNLNVEKRIFEEDTTYCNDPWELPDDAFYYLNQCGSSLGLPDIDALLNGEY